MEELTPQQLKAFQQLYKNRDMKDFVPLPLIPTRLASAIKIIKKIDKNKKP